MKNFYKYSLGMMCILQIIMCVTDLLITGKFDNSSIVMLFGLWIIIELEGIKEKLK